MTRLVGCWLRNLADHIDPPRRPAVRIENLHVGVDNPQRLARSIRPVPPACWAPDLTAPPGPVTIREETIMLLNVLSAGAQLLPWHAIGSAIGGLIGDVIQAALR